MGENRHWKTRKVRDTIGVRTVLEQLVEECAELQQVCMKYIRKLDDTNPTPKTKESIIANMTEEVADVQLCIECLPSFIRNHNKIVQWKEYKIDRWLQRLAENDERTGKDV